MVQDFDENAHALESQGLAFDRLLNLGGNFPAAFSFETDRPHRADLGAFPASDADFRVDPGHALRRHLDGPDRAFPDADLAADAVIGDDLGGFDSLLIPGHRSVSGSENSLYIW
jgi:hypothetical protein